jgi:hypothetical protein
LGITSLSSSTETPFSLWELNGEGGLTPKSYPSGTDLYLGLWHLKADGSLEEYPEGHNDTYWEKDVNNNIVPKSL